MCFFGVVWRGIGNAAGSAQFQSDFLECRQHTGHNHVYEGIAAKRQRHGGMPHGWQTKNPHNGKKESRWNSGLV